MATKALYRKVSIYINGKEIESTIGSLLGCMERLKEQQKAMTIGSEEYIETSLKIKEIKSVLEDQRRAIQSAAKDWDAVRQKSYQNGLRKIFFLKNWEIPKKLRIFAVALLEHFCFQQALLLMFKHISIKQLY